MTLSGDQESDAQPTEPPQRPKSTNLLLVLPTLRHLYFKTKVKATRNLLSRKQGGWESPLGAN